MGDIDRDVKIVLNGLLDLVSPKGMDAGERRRVARNAGISEQTLRKNLQRKSLNADTLIRLLLARGIERKTLIELPQTDISRLPPGESDWLLLGRELSDIEKKEFVSLLRFLRSKWRLN